MVQCNSQNFDKICNSINMKNPKSVDLKQIPVLLQKTQDGSVPGFCSSLIALARRANQPHLLGTTSEEQALVQQWLDYAGSTVNYVDAPTVSRQVLKDLNYTLSERTFVAGHSRSLADIVLYHLLFKAMSNLTFQEKEQFLHLSRWYNNMQQDCSIRGSNASLTFSRTILY